MSSSRQRGLSLIEVVVFIIVLGVGFAGMAIIYNQVTLASVDPLVRKQAVAIANSLMEEIQARAFTYCDPDDPLVFTAANSTVCGTPEGIGAEGETRYADPRYDNVSDYNGFKMIGSIQDIANSTVAGLTGYSAEVAVADAGGEFVTVPATPVLAAAEALHITVTVTGPANVRVVLEGYRLRYAPNAP